ncbi:MULTISPECIES: phage tail tube protein [Chromobacterium]|uniref:phage tail tube protein n=1 Tax=Chromobacterium TaxID=535 RepID=UPI0009DA0DA6|nr:MULTISPECIES: phage tail tube protein [Chromobacterium]AXE31636.1 hypothetical protein DK842_18060 [Chromobacterium phragmitis]MBX9267202.1 hypothetical protein [Chromobacterium violaceum]OQS10065.1 hypothetical protein B0T38_10870 [Chromobacterium violaceum]OQS26480.1 hypothetical protein B0T37_10475 [Chromobacterium violaceum]QRO33964.1 hypothetical protein I6K04_04265 [Chromobacterium violaceum]
MPSNAISAQGSKLSIESAGDKPSFVQIKEIQSYSGFDGKASELDVTTLDSTAKEKRKGLKDNGGFQFELNRVLDDPGQLLLDAAQNEDQPRRFKLELPNGKSATFSALVMSFDLKGGVDAVLKGSATLSISGAVTWA